MKTFRKSIGAFIVLALMPIGMKAQQTLTLDECRQMAIQSNKDIEMARTKIKMSEYDKKIATANYFPNISVTGSYMYNEKNLSLVNDETSAKLRNMGTTIHGMTSKTMMDLMQAVKSNPAAVKEFMTSPLLQTLMGGLSKADMSAVINQIGSEIDDALHLDIHNVFVGAVSLQQPVFMGGKIVAANKIARLAEQLSKSQYDQKYQEVLVNIDQSYWQIVSIANKLKLAESYSDLLHKLENDVNISMEAGVMTESDLLQIKVKVNEADMLKTKALNGLTLSKMLLCKQIGIDLDSDIQLADEQLEEIPMPEVLDQKSMDQIYEDRPEIKSLNLASKIYDKKVNVMRADMLPKVALTANYLVTNPNSFKGFQNKWGGTFNAGVIVNIPIFHAFEATNKTRKAKTEASLYRIQLADAKNLINLQVTQLRKQQNEALEKLGMARNNMANAEENLRTASVGFEAGIIPTNTALAAHTAWLQAHSEFIDAGIELQMNNANLRKAEGSYKTDEK